MRVLGKRSLASGIKILLDIAYVLVIVAAVVAALAIIPMSFLDTCDATIAQPVHFQLVGDAYRIGSLKWDIQSAELVEAQGRLRVVGVSRTYLLVGLATVALLAAFAAVALRKLRAVFRTLKEGDPFVAANVARIRFVGFAVLIGELARAMWVFWNSVYLRLHLDMEGIRLRSEFDLHGLTILAGLLLLVIAEVFRVGVQMKEEQELTV
jgi:hypothetical protein